MISKSFGGRSPDYIYANPQTHRILRRPIFVGLLGPHCPFHQRPDWTLEEKLGIHCIRPHVFVPFAVLDYGSSVVGLGTGVPGSRSS